MRKLQTSDVFAALRLSKAANLREELKPLMKRATESSEEVQEVGIEGILSLIELLSEKKAETAMYEVLARPFEMKPEEVAQLDIVTLAENLNTLAKENDLQAFFGHVSAILGKN